MFLPYMYQETMQFSLKTFNNYNMRVIVYSELTYMTLTPSRTLQV